MVALLAFCLAIAQPTVDDSVLLRVGLTRLNLRDQAVVFAPGAWTVRDGESNAELAVLRGQATIQLKAGEWVIDGKAVSANSISIDAPNLKIGARDTDLRAYRGAVCLTKPNGRILAVNWLALGDYLRSALPSEMPSNFPEEALKAQCVAARSYALNRINRHRGEGYDLCDAEHCQLYLGVSMEKTQTTEIVRKTGGEVAAHNGKPIEAVYCADCGGHTADVVQAGVGVTPTAYLVGSPDWSGTGERFCAGSPRSGWDARIEQRAVDQKFGFSVERLQIIERTEGGHAMRIEATGGGKRAVMIGADFRRAFGLAQIKNLMFALQRERDGWSVRGRGSGHGVGLCQWGAAGRARAGQTYLEILSAYYPGSKVERR